MAASFSRGARKLYRLLKGNVEQNFGYTKQQNAQIEGIYDWFDIRLLPRKYRRGLDIAPSRSSAFILKTVDEAEVETVDFDEYKRIDGMMVEAHNEVLRRAIDDGYDLEAAARNNYGQYFRRPKRWWRSQLGFES